MMYILEHKIPYIVPEPMKKTAPASRTAGNKCVCAATGRYWKRHSKNGATQRTGELRKRRMRWNDERCIEL